MPPSTATYVRTPGIGLIVPTSYTVTAAPATMARPGSTLTAERTPAARQASSTALAHSAKRRCVLALDVGDAEPAAEHQLREVERDRRTPAITSAARAKKPAANTFEPMWQCRPTRLHRRRPAGTLDGSRGVAVGRG